MRRGSTRRQFWMGGLASVAMGSAMGGRALGMAAAPGSGGPRPTAKEALALLQEGNRHFAAGSLTHPGRRPEDFEQLVGSQQPIAAILGCADSRVPPEILFDQPIGGLFTVRIAGNYVDGAGSAVKGSLEYAVAELGVPLIVVLGHGGCGAVKAAIQHIREHDALPGAMNEMVNQLKPAVLEAEHGRGDPLARAIEANVVRGVRRLETLQPILAARVQARTLDVVGMTYDLKDGRVRLVAS